MYVRQAGDPYTCMCDKQVTPTHVCMTTRCPLHMQLLDVQSELIFPEVTMKLWAILWQCNGYHTMVLHDKTPAEKPKTQLTLTYEPRPLFVQQSIESGHPQKVQ